MTTTITYFLTTTVLIASDSSLQGTSIRSESAIRMK